MFPDMRTKLISYLLIGGLLAAALPAQASHTSNKRWPTDRWMKTLSKQTYSSVVRTTHYIEAEDGTQLSLTVHLPAGLPEGKKVPTLMQMTPYRPLDQGLGGYGDYEFFVLRGAAYVEADERGTGGSEGCLDFGGSADRSDAKVFAQWIRSQPWSDGRIVTDGVSHPGMGSVVAHAAIPGLTGALTHAPVVSYYQDEWLQGAKFEDQFNGPAYQAVELAPPLPPEFGQPEAVSAQGATCTGKTTTDYSTYDGPFTELWADRDLSRVPPKERKPILLTHGFIDLNVHPDHSQLYWDALPDDYPKYAIFGWWYHGYPDMKGHDAGNFDFIRHRWMDALLFKTNNGLWHEPRVLVEDSLGVWHEGHDWPLEQSSSERLYANPEGVLSPSAAKGGEVSYIDEIGAERGSWDGASAVFETQEISKDMLINGAPDVFLKASSSETSTKWVAYLMDVAPDGSWERISHGYADSHTWKKPNRWDEIEPGKPYRWKIEMMPTAVVVKQGHRVALVIASQDSRNSPTNNNCFDDYRGGCYNPSGIAPALTAGRAENTVYLGKNGTSVRWDWADPKTTVKAPTRHGM